jgi:hypothetical protein
VKQDWRTWTIGSLFNQMSLTLRFTLDDTSYVGTRYLGVTLCFPFLLYEYHNTLLHWQEEKKIIRISLLEKTVVDPIPIFSSLWNLYLNSVQDDAVSVTSSIFEVYIDCSFVLWVL